MINLHEIQKLSKCGDSHRVAVPGGWVYRVWSHSLNDDTGYTALCFVPDPTASHVRDLRRLRIRDGWEFTDSSAITSWSETSRPQADCVVRLFKDARWHVIAWHADKSFTQHATLLEAHDALVESGSPSPFEVVKGSAVEPTPDAKTWKASGMGPGHDAGP
jgi:hypothetical protein